MVCLDKSNLQDHKREERRIEKSSILLLKMLEDFQQTVLLMKEHCHWVIFTDTQASYAAVSTAANSSCYCGHTYICHPYFFLLSKSAQATIICIVCPVLYQCFRRGMTLFSSPSCPLNSQYRSASKATMQSLPETSTAFRFFTSWAMEKGQSTRHRWQKPAWAAEKSNSAEGWRAEGSKRQTERERGRERDKVREREREGKKKWICLEMGVKTAQSQAISFHNALEHIRWVFQGWYWFTDHKPFLQNQFLFKPVHRLQAEIQTWFSLKPCLAPS